ncbi:MAG: hypothetical protein AAB401_10345, partial [Acidobacteriota bacterium]
MLKQTSIYLLFLLAAFPPIQSNQNPPPTRDPQNRQVTISNPSTYATTSAASSRRNIARVFDKLRRGGAVTVAYIGGSITLGTGAGNPEKSSYRALVSGWLRPRFP